MSDSLGNDEAAPREYYGGICNDAGTCDYTASTMMCVSSGTPLDCFNGGCRLVIVR